MTALKTSIELIVCIALIIGFCHERQIAEWEFKQRKRIKLAVLRTARKKLLSGETVSDNVKVITRQEHKQLHQKGYMGKYAVCDLDSGRVLLIPKNTDKS